MNLKKLGNLKKLAVMAAWARDGLAEAERKHGIEAACAFGQKHASGSEAIVHPNPSKDNPHDDHR